MKKANLVLCQKRDRHLLRGGLSSGAMALALLVVCLLPTTGALERGVFLCGFVLPGAAAALLLGQFFHPPILLRFIPEGLQGQMNFSGISRISWEEIDRFAPNIIDGQAVIGIYLKDPSSIAPRLGRRLSYKEKADLRRRLRRRQAPLYFLPLACPSPRWSC